MDKVPIKIIQVYDNHGNKQVGAMLDIAYYQYTKGDAAKKMKSFERLYFNTVKKAKDIFNEHKRKNSKYYWIIGKILYELNETAESEFYITNYRTALQRDFELTGSYIGVIIDFNKFFKDEEIQDNVPWSVYFELTSKARKLDKLGLFTKEKLKLIEFAKEKKVPNRKSYRKYLAQLIISETE